MASEQRPTICIIGAGASGITAAKACKEENFNYVIYEMSPYNGGLWRYHDDDVEGIPSVTRSTIINSSKEMSAFSDCVPDEKFPNYMHNSRMIQYLEQYAQSIGCDQYTKYRHKVLSCTPGVTFEHDGRWNVEVLDMSARKKSTQTFDGVMVCTGHHVTPTMPTFDGQDKFRGEILHTHSYKKPTRFEGKRVVVVGVGNSGVDAAVELSACCPRVCLSTRRGAWVVYRVGPNGKPFDSQFLRRDMNALWHAVPYKLRCSVTEFYINRRFDHAQYRLKPKHRIFEQHITVNDALPNRLLSGTLELKNNVKCITDNGVIFEGDANETLCDVIIMATGYKVEFPFIDPSLVPVDDNRVDLYKYVFSPNLGAQAHTLAFIGLVQPIGALFPISEIQSRWFAQIMAGKRQLPSVQKMTKDIMKKHEYLQSRYYAGPRNTLQVDWIDYMDELAELVGCKPTVYKYLYMDPALWWHLVFGPCVPYQYRLEGPHKWTGARKAIMSAEKRIMNCLHTRELTDKNGEIIRD